MSSCKMYVGMKDLDKQVNKCEDFEIQIGSLLNNLATTIDFKYFTTISNKITDIILCVLKNKLCETQESLQNIVKIIINFEKLYKTRLDNFFYNKYKQNDLIDNYYSLYAVLFTIFIMIKKTGSR